VEEHGAVSILKRRVVPVLSLLQNLGYLQLECYKVIKRSEEAESREEKRGSNTLCNLLCVMPVIDQSPCVNLPRQYRKKDFLILGQFIIPRLCL
jgi:hypothetical protein